MRFLTSGVFGALLIICTSECRALASPQSHYVRRDVRNPGVIVFVHGLMGDAKTTWTNTQTGAYWPDLLTKDAAFNGFDVYVYEYPSPGMADTYSIDEAAENMRLLFDTDGVSRHDSLVIVAHSLGGVVTRAFLTKNREYASRVKFIYFFATPTTGSDVARLGTRFSKNPQFKELRPMTSESYLADLQRNWLDAHFVFPSYCAYEKQPTFGKLIVEQQSAAGLCTRRLDPIDANHIEIVKPENARSASYLAFRSAFEEAVSKAQAKPTPKPHQPPIERTAKFAVMIPFDTAPDSSPIPLDENPDDPLFRTYAAMQSLATNGTVPETAREAKGEGQITWKAKPISMSEAPAFLGELLQYYIFRSIDGLQRNSMTVSVGYPADANPGIEPPDAEQYPYKKLFQKLADNVFFRPFTHRPSGDEMAWKLKSVSVPKATEILFMRLQKPDRYVVRFHRPSYFMVDFIVENFAGTGIGQAPKRFSTPHVSTTMLWTFFVTMRYQIAHPDDEDFNPNNYKQWLDALHDGLHKQLVAE